MSPNIFEDAQRLDPGGLVAAFRADPTFAVPEGGRLLEEEPTSATEVLDYTHARLARDFVVDSAALDHVLKQWLERTTSSGWSVTEQLCEVVVGDNHYDRFVRAEQPSGYGVSDLAAVFTLTAAGTVEMQVAAIAPHPDDPEPQRLRPLSSAEGRRCI